MGTWSRTCFPILEVLLTEHQILSFDEMMKRLVRRDPHRLSSEREILYSMNNMIACLKLNPDTNMVSYDKNSITYCKMDSYERTVQIYLHKALPENTWDKWQLYPFLHRSNSPCCYQSIPWDKIPLNNKYSAIDDNCNAHPTSKTDGICSFGCGVTADIIDLIDTYKFMHQKTLHTFHAPSDPNEPPF